MIGVTFGNYHSYDDFDLILSSKSIGSPATKTETVNIPGADGVLDFTEFFGEPKYKNRKLEFTFSSKEPYSTQLEQDSIIKNALHGQKMNIILDSDPDYYYVGRIEVGTWNHKKNIGKVKITCDCEPWKYKNAETTVLKSVDGSTTFKLYNTLRKSIVPTVTTTAEVNISWIGGRVSLAAGTYTLTNLVILGGAHKNITLTGTADVTFTYREASL